jgi:hypothetical protein
MTWRKTHLKSVIPRNRKGNLRVGWAGKIKDDINLIQSRDTVAMGSIHGCLGIHRLSVLEL